jgi:hypothetical protein
VALNEGKLKRILSNGNEVSRNPFTLVLYRPIEHQKHSHHSNNLAAYVVLPGFNSNFIPFDGCLVRFRKHQHQRFFLEIYFTLCLAGSVFCIYFMLPFFTTLKEYYLGLQNCVLSVQF